MNRGLLQENPGQLHVAAAIVVIHFVLHGGSATLADGLGERAADGIAPVEVNAGTKGLHHNNQLSSPPAQGRRDRKHHAPNRRCAQDFPVLFCALRMERLLRSSQTGVNE
jgi:hypothetical protein